MTHGMPLVYHDPKIILYPEPLKCINTLAISILYYNPYI